MNSREPAGPRIAFETRITLFALAAGGPAVVAALALLWKSDQTARWQWTLTAAILICWIGFALAARDRLIRPLQTLSNLLSALHEGDFSIRLRGSKPGDALDDVFREANTLSDTLHAQRLGAVEATALLRTVMTEIEVAVFTFDDEARLRLVNRAGEHLLASQSEALLGRTAAEIGLAEFFEGTPHRTSERAFPGGSGRWGIRVSTFREDGRPHRLLVIEDLTRALREEELQAWKRLVRVLGHELNNSLAPIRSIAGSLAKLVERDPLAEDWRDDTLRGLNVIESRSESLTRFLESYARLAKLPPPRIGVVDVGPWLRRVALLESRAPIAVGAGPELKVPGDSDQLEQLVINLLANAAEASAESGGGVELSWRVHGTWLEVSVRDEGPGIANPANLFVPFFTTKPRGSGIGLVLCRQIAEGHGGGLTLENRPDRPGAEAVLRIPTARQ